MICAYSIQVWKDLEDNTCLKDVFLGWEEGGEVKWGCIEERLKSWCLTSTLKSFKVFLLNVAQSIYLAHNEIIFDDRYIHPIQHVIQNKSTHMVSNNLPTKSLQDKFQLRRQIEMELGNILMVLIKGAFVLVENNGLFI